MRILFVIPYTPNLIRVRPYNFIRALARRGHRLTVLTLTTSAEEVEQARALASEAEVLTQPLPRWRSIANAIRALPGATPLQAVYCWHPALAGDLQWLVQQGAFDVVHVEHIRGARYGASLRNRVTDEQRPPVIWDSVDCITSLFRQASAQSRSLFGRLVTRLELGRTEKYERALLQQFEHVLVTSPSDRRSLSALAQDAQPTAPITVVPNGVDFKDFYPDQDRRYTPDTLVFSGKMSYHANVTMALHLVHDIMPIVWSQRPGVRLTIVGKDPPGEVVALAGNDAVQVTGTVESIRPYLQQAAVAVVPLQYGAGIQNKILEAMACSTPVITTSQAIHALNAKIGHDLLVADDASSFAGAILNLLSDTERRRSIATSGLDYVSRHHDWDGIARQLEQIYESEIMRKGTTG